MVPVKVSKEQIQLPPPVKDGAVSLEKAIALRRSVRGFVSEPLAQYQLAQILWAAQGITDVRRRRRAVPSAGATYPLKIFIACGKNGVEGVPAGIYQYSADTHSLIPRYQADVRLDLAQAALNQEFISEAPLIIVICAVYEWTETSYGKRAERYVHMEVGHAGQNIYLRQQRSGWGQRQWVLFMMNWSGKSYS